MGRKKLSTKTELPTLAGQKETTCHEERERERERANIVIQLSSTFPLLVLTWEVWHVTSFWSSPQNVAVIFISLYVVSSWYSTLIFPLSHIPANYPFLIFYLITSPRELTLKPYFCLVSEGWTYLFLIIPHLRRKFGTLIFF